MLSAKEHLGSHRAIIHSGCECSPLNKSVPGSQSRQKTQLLWIVVGLLTGFFVAEWSVGLWSHALSLQADAGHILSDVAALGISLLASWLAQKPAAGIATFGHRRVEILAALVNGCSLLAIAALICWEAIHRFQSPEEVLGLPMLAIAAVGLVVNLLNINLLHQHSHHDLNLRGAFLHVVADTASSVGVIIAALAVHFLNWFWADAAVSLLVASLTGLSALPLVGESLKILLEYAPSSIEPSKVEAALKSFPGVLDVEKLHIWTINSGMVMLCADLTVESSTAEQRDRLLRQLQAYLHQEFGILEAILQLTSPNSKAAIPLHPLFNQNLISMLSRTP